VRAEPVTVRIGVAEDACLHHLGIGPVLVALLGLEVELQPQAFAGSAT
jgi:hypothetical protein